MTAVTDATPALGGVPLGAPIRWRLTWATAHRVLSQLRHDPRTVLMLQQPCPADQGRDLGHYYSPGAGS